MGPREGHTCSRSHSESVTELGLEAQLRLTSSCLGLPEGSSHRPPLFGQQKRCLELRGGGDEGRSPELGVVVSARTSVTSFVQQIRTVRIVSGPIWGLSFSIYTGVDGTPGWASIIAPAERPDWQPLSGASLPMMSGNLEPLPSPGGRARTGGCCQAGCPWLEPIVRLLTTLPSYPHRHAPPLGDCPTHSGGQQGTGEQFA